MGESLYKGYAQNVQYSYKIKARLHTSRRSIIEFTIEGFIQRYKTFFPDAMSVQIEYATELYKLITYDKDTNIVTVSNGRCGLGKSTFVKSLINYFLIDDNGRFRSREAVGMVVVTDMIQRAHEYLGYNHDKYCAFITAKDENPNGFLPAIQLSFAKNKPVIIITSQRFFNMDDNDRQMLFRYRLESDRDWQKRSIVIIDEKPYFHDVTEVRVKNFNDCDTALRNLTKDCPDKSWIIQEWAPYREKMLALFRSQELIKVSCNKDVFYWFDAYASGLTSNDEHFFHLITASKVKKCLLSNYPNFFRDIDSFRHLMTEGALFIATKAEATANQTDDACFLLPRDNRHVFYLGQDKAKFFVLDGTADIDPDYKVDYVQIIDASAYNIKLPLTIQLINVPTSRSVIVNRNRAFTEEQHMLLRQEIINHIDTQSSNHTLVVTYKDIEDCIFPNGAYENCVTTGHFGGLRGKNEFRNLTYMDHIGFHRLSNLSYYIKYLALHPEELSALRTMGICQSRSYINKKLKIVRGIFASQELNDIMFRAVLVDFEQNIFRLAIRSYDNVNPVIIRTYWNCTTYTQLNRMIAERYSPYGAQIINLGTPAVFEQHKVEKRKSSNGNRENNRQRVLAWLKAQPTGKMFSATEARKEIGLTHDEFKSTKKGKAIKDLLNKWKTDTDGIYRVS